MNADTAHRVTVRFEEDVHIKLMQGVIDMMKKHRKKTNVNALVNFIIANADMPEVLRQMAKGKK